jgi:AraC-like DNA-binding protein
MIVLKEIQPTPMLREFVRLYRIVDFKFPEKTPIPPKAYPPWPEHCLQFFTTPNTISYDNGRRVITIKQSLLAGQHTELNTRVFYDDLLSFQIVFQPGALYRLLGIPTGEFTNRVIDADEVFGKEIAEICEKLYEAPGYDEMIGIGERFVLNRLGKLKKDAHAVDRFGQQMLFENGSSSLDKFIDGACLSHRQFDRKFLERIGVGAKEFMRVTRFYQTYLTKNRYPMKDGLTLALECGYYDYQHLSRDFKEFTGYTPKQFFALDSPERKLGSEEVY